MYTIHLHQLSFRGFHGIHEEERIIGNTFIVEVAVQIDIPGRVEALTDTLDYVSCYNIIQKRMQQPTALLENIAEDIIAAIKAADNRVSSIECSIRKQDPPIQHFIGSVGITLKKSF